jgi:hypothetical protein
MQQSLWPLVSLFDTADGSGMLLRKVIKIYRTTRCEVYGKVNAENDSAQNVVSFSPHVIF